MGAIKWRARRQRSKEHAEKALYYCLLFMYLFWEITTYQTIYGIVVILLVSFWMTLEQQNVKRTKIKLYRFNICDSVYLFSYRNKNLFFSNKCFSLTTRCIIIHYFLLKSTNQNVHVFGKFCNLHTIKCESKNKTNR